MVNPEGLFDLVMEVCLYGGLQVGWHKLRREFTHARNFEFKIPTKSVRMRGFSSQVCANQPANLCNTRFHS